MAESAQTTPETTPGVDARQLRRRLALLALAIGAVVAAIASLPGLDEVRSRFGGAQPEWLAVAFAVELASILSFVVALRGAFSRVPGWRACLSLGTAEQGANVLLPAGGTGGLAIGAVIARNAGVPEPFAAARTVTLFLATSLMTFLAVVISGIALFTRLFDGEVGWYLSVLPAAGAALTIAAVAASARMMPPGEEPEEKPGGEERGRVRKFLTRFGRYTREGVIDARTMILGGKPLLLGGAIGYLVFDIAVLGASFQAFGGDGPPVAAFVMAYAIGQAGAIIPAPGGIGGTEGGLIGMFVLFGTPLAIATTAVLGYRVFQLGMPAIAGTFGFIDIGRFMRDPLPTEEVASRYTEAIATSATRDDPAN